MPPTPIPALPSTSTSTTRSSVFRHVKRAQEGTDAPAIVLAVVCAILLLVVLLSVARYFHRIKCFFSLSSPRPRGRFTFSWLFPRRLVSLRTSNPTSRTPHSNPFPPRDPARPWSQYRPAYLRVYHPHRPYPYHSCRVAECRSDGLKVDLPGDRIPHRRIGFIIHLPGDLAAHRRQRPSSMRCPQVRTSASVPEVGHAPEITVTNDVNEVDVQILQQQNTLSIRAVVCAPGIRTLEEVQIGHEVDSECDTAGDMAFESASRTAIPQARTDERRLGECEPSEARRDKYTGSVSLHSTFSDDDDSDVDGGSDDQEYGGNDADSDGENKPRSDSGESTYSVEQGRSAVPEVLEPQISPPVSFDDLADLYYFEDEEEEDAINRSYDFSLELVGSSNRPGSYLGIPGPAWFPPAVRFSPPVKVRLPCCRPLSPMRPPCHRSSFDQECANNEESQLPIVDKAGMDVGPLPDSIRASAWGRACQETLNAIVVTQAEAETEHQLPQLDLNSKTTNNLQKDTARHPDSDANHTRERSKRYHR
ncbi:hypothetical protein EDC04DRAFT_1071414 [Pisolithus marmoratus]|nr:hypothetical protein EDC04DRAFT_1071414 [Pisolithus marmoratus]